MNWFKTLTNLLWVFLFIIKTCTFAVEDDNITYKERLNQYVLFFKNNIEGEIIFGYSFYITLGLLIIQFIIYGIFTILVIKSIKFVYDNISSLLRENKNKEKTK